MSRKISLEKARQLQKKELEVKELQKAGETVQSDRAERKQQERDEKKQLWMEDMKERGGFSLRRAKKWGDYCSHSECPKWEDEECAYTERDTKGCYLSRESEG